MSEENFDQYSHVINTLVSECVSCAPSAWQKGTLTIDCDGNAINYKLKNTDSEEAAQISSMLGHLCEELYVVMRQNGNIWLEAIIHYFKKDESWSFNIDFIYPNKYPTAINSKAEYENKPKYIKPTTWWKFW